MIQFFVQFHIFITIYIPILDEKLIHSDISFNWCQQSTLILFCSSTFSITFNEFEFAIMCSSFISICFVLYVFDGFLKLYSSLFSYIYWIEILKFILDYFFLCKRNNKIRQKIKYIRFKICFGSCICILYNCMRYSKCLKLSLKQ